MLFRRTLTHEPGELTGYLCRRVFGRGMVLCPPRSVRPVRCAFLPSLDAQAQDAAGQWVTLSGVLLYRYAELAPFALEEIHRIDIHPMTPADVMGLRATLA